LKKLAQFERELKMKSEQKLFNEIFEETPLKLASKEEFLELLHTNSNQPSNAESYDPIK
jgi:hypothetical protein